jgi:hypothetical protein
MMRNKRDQELLRYAFGELEEGRTEALRNEAEHDSELAAELKAQERFAVNLNLLKDVPEDQYSKERLRAAILERCLEPREPAKPKLGWLWMPAVAFGLTFAIMLLPNLQPKAEPMVVKDPNPMRNQMTPPVVLNRTTVAAKKPEPQLAQATKPNALAVGTAPVQANQKRNRKSYATLVASRSGERTVTPAATQSSAPVVKQPVKPTTKPESDPVVLPASNDEPIVIIGTLPDAPGRATETEAVTGVLVGG